MSCTNTSEWIAAGDAQLAAANITGAAYTHARLSLLTLNPYQPGGTPALSGPINTALPYFILGDGGCPQLVNPAATLNPAAGDPLIDQSTALLSSPSPEAVPAGVSLVSPGPQPIEAPPVTGSILVPPGTPCPEGFVSSGAQPADLQQEVQRQLTNTIPRSSSAAGGCTPQIVMAPQQMTTKNDFLVVSASSIFTAFASNTGTVPLTVFVRLLTCAGQIQIMQSSLDLVHTLDAGAVQGEICIPLTDGYLLSVVASGAPFCTQPGEVWVQGELRYGGCQGVPSMPLFKGYLVDQSYLGWPGGPQTIWGQGNGANHASDLGTSLVPTPAWIPEQGTRVRLSQASLSFTTGATGSDRKITLVWFPPVGTANYLYSSTFTQPVSKKYQYTWANGIQAGVMDGTSDPGGGAAFDAVVQIPLPPDIIGNGDAELKFQFDNQDHTVDSIEYCGVLYEAWAEPSDTGF